MNESRGPSWPWALLLVLSLGVPACREKELTDREVEAAWQKEFGVALARMPNARTDAVNLGPCVDDAGCYLPESHRFNLIGDIGFKLHGVRLGVVDGCGELAQQKARKDGLAALPRLARACADVLREIDEERARLHKLSDDELGRLKFVGVAEMREHMLGTVQARVQN